MEAETGEREERRREEVEKDIEILKDAREGVVTGVGHSTGGKKKRQENTSFRSSSRARRVASKDLSMRTGQEKDEKSTRKVRMDVWMH